MDATTPQQPLEAKRPDQPQLTDQTPSSAHRSSTQPSLQQQPPELEQPDRLQVSDQPSLSAQILPVQGSQQTRKQQRQSGLISASERRLIFLERNTNISDAMRVPYWDDGTAQISFAGLLRRLDRQGLLETVSIKPTEPDVRLDKLHEKLYALRKEFSADLLRELIANATMILKDWIDQLCPQPNVVWKIELVREVRMNLESIPGLHISNTTLYPGHLEDFEAKLIKAELIDIDQLDLLRLNDPNPGPDNSRAALSRALRGRRRY